MAVQRAGRCDDGKGREGGREGGKEGGREGGRDGGLDEQMNGREVKRGREGEGWVDG